MFNDHPHRFDSVFWEGFFLRKINFREAIAKVHVPIYLFQIKFIFTRNELLPLNKCFVVEIKLLSILKQ